MGRRLRGAGRLRVPRSRPAPGAVVPAPAGAGHVRVGRGPDSAGAGPTAVPDSGRAPPPAGPGHGRRDRAFLAGTLRSSPLSVSEVDCTVDRVALRKSPQVPA